MSLALQILAPEGTHDLRHRVLRPGRPRETCLWDGDDLPTTVHLGLADERGQVVAVASWFRRPPPHRTAGPGWQLRGMAVELGRQGQGLGAELLRHGMATLEARSEGAPGWLWCNARTSAVPVYERQGGVTVGAEFDIPHVGPHYVMERAFPGEAIG